MSSTLKKVSASVFGTLESEDGQACKEVKKFTLQNKNGMIVEAIEFGATITSVKVPLASGQHVDLVLGSDDLNWYRGIGRYTGASCGRVAGRIRNAKFTLEGKEYKLFKNSGENSLHGGEQGFESKLWVGSALSDHSVCFTLVSPDMEEGYPGDVMLNCIYNLTDDNELEVSYKALTSKTTILNLTQHSYFNLRGHQYATSQGIYNHELMVNADKYVPFDDEYLPLGVLKDVIDNPDEQCTDFRSYKRLGDVMHRCPGGDYQGYVLPFVVNTDNHPKHNGEMKFACAVKDPESPIKMEVSTNQPCVLFYTSTYLPKNNSMKGKDGAIYQFQGAMCFETEVFHDALNNDFPKDVVLKPGNIYDHRVTYKFIV